MSDLDKTVKNVLGGAFILIFMGVWSVGIYSGYNAAECRNEDLTATQKLRHCDRAIRWGSYFGETRKQSIIFLERAIAHARLGTEQEAADDMLLALNAATNGIPQFVLARPLVRPSHLSRLIDRMFEEPEGAVAYTIWVNVFESAKG